MPNNKRQKTSAVQPNTTSKLSACPLFNQPPAGPLPAPDMPSTSQSQALTKCELFGTVKIDWIKIQELRLGVSTQVGLIGRVVHVSELRTWDNAKGSGKAFSITLIDQTGEIILTMFNNKVDDFLDKFKVFDVIKVTGFRAKTVDPGFRTIPDQSLELILSYNGLVEKSTVDEDNVPQIPFNFSDVSLINEMERGSLVDCLGIIFGSEDLIEGLGKDGKTFAFRNLQITDRTMLSFGMKLWGQLAIDLVMTEPTAFVIRRGKVDEYEKQKSINVSANTLFLINPSLVEAQDMLTWFKTATTQNE